MLNPDKFAAPEVKHEDDEEEDGVAPRNTPIGLPDPLSMPKLTKLASGGFFAKPKEPEPDAKHPSQVQKKLNALNSKIKPVPTDEQKE